MKLGQYLFERIKQAGADHVFGVPGDFSMALLNAGLKSSLEYVGTCNELNAAYAADAYSRIKGLGACVTTYAVGELSAVNGIAGAFAESVPVVMLVGSPLRQYYKQPKLLHHTLGDYMIPQKMYDHITVANTLLDNEETAVAEIDRVLTACLHESKPVYISVPSDMAMVDIEPPKDQFKAPAPGKSDEATLKEAVDEIISHLAKAKSPLLLPGIELIRRGLVADFAALVEKTNVPFATMMLCKGILDEDHDRFIGLFSGARSRPDVLDRVQGADVILVLGEKLTDFNTGGFTAGLTHQNSIYIGWNFVRVNNHYFPDIYIHDVIRKLVQEAPTFDPKDLPVTKAKDTCAHRPEIVFAKEGNTKLTMDRLFKRMATLFREKAIIIAETGASLFSAAETKLPPGAIFLTQTFYGSIGYTVGACLGACIAVKGTEIPVYLFVGDGSFQVTGQDLSTVIRYKCNPYVFIINNDGYTIERTIYDNVYNDIQMWKYADVPAAFGGSRGEVCGTEEALERALDRFASEREGPRVFEIVLDRMDCNQLLLEAGKVMAKNNKLEE